MPRCRAGDDVVTDQLRDSASGVLVGVDGSDTALAAAEWAARTAAALHATLTVCTVFPDPVGSESELHARGVLITGSALVRARHVAPDVPTSRALRYGGVADQLTAAATDMRLVVVGRPTIGWHLIGGSVSFQLAVRSPCSLVAVPWTRPDRTAPVLVGVGGEHATPALEHAFEVAARDGVGVHAIHAYHSNAHRAEAERYLHDAVEPWAEKHPNQPVSMTVERGEPVTVLAVAAHHASSLVVGKPSHGELIGSMLGSVSYGALALATCPVIVAH